MKILFQSILCLIIYTLFVMPLNAQTNSGAAAETHTPTDFSDRQAIIKTIENFYIGDHTGSIEHMKLSMHEKGAYRYVNKDGEYSEGVFDLESGYADTNYKEELLSIEIYSKVALVRLRQEVIKDKSVHYKLMTLHKTSEGWKITSINWGLKITQ